jgi:hypothetical protein
MRTAEAFHTGFRTSEGSEIWHEALSLRERWARQEWAGGQPGRLMAKQPAEPAQVPLPGCDCGL